MILLIDNYDSFTYNLYDYLAQAGNKICVKRNDEISVREINDLGIGAIVISPGPKRPVDAGITMDVISEFHRSVPILGICLGYQAIGQFFGARVQRSSEPFHGKTSEIRLETDPIFKNIPAQLSVMRYHSLNISEIPSSLKVIAMTASTHEPMAIKHIHLPLYGFQFHPESILTEHGLQMIRNWTGLFHTDPILNLGE